MRVKLKGLFWARSKLADGTYKDYWYAWKGGPRLRGDPGTPEFIASYNAAVATKIAAPEGRLLRLLQEYQRSQDFLGLRDKTRRDYIGHIKKIEVRFGDMPIKALADQRSRGVFKDWRDELALKSLRGADYTWTVLAAVLAWRNRTVVSATPLRRPNSELRTREYLTPAEVDRLVEAAKSNRWGHRDATMVLVAYRHGFRAVELVDLRWDQVDFAHATLHVRRAKGGKPSSHPLQGDVMRALRRLRKDDPHGEFVSGRPVVTAAHPATISR
jgi:integrase